MTDLATTTDVDEHLEHAGTAVADMLRLAAVVDIEAAVVDLTHSLRSADLVEALVAAQVGDPVALALTCHDLDRLITAAKDARREVAAALVPHLKRGEKHTLELPGIGAAQRMPGGTTVEWDTDALVPRVVAAALDPARRADPETGELADPVASVVDAITTAARFEWRAGATDGTTGLRSLGIDPNDYRATNRQPDTVRIIVNAVGER